MHVDARERASAVAAFLEEHRYVMQSLVKCFFIDDLWSNALPASWHEPLDRLSLDDLADMLTKPEPPAGADEWPPSLLAFFRGAHSLRLPGQLLPRGAADGSGNGSAGDAAAAASAGSATAESAKELSRAAEKERVPFALRACVKVKKMHEIVVASELVDAVGRLSACEYVCDVGSGLGYLSRMLAFEYNWRVVAVEKAEANVVEANRIDVNVRKKLNVRIKDGRECAWRPDVGALRHVAAHLPPQVTPDEFWAALFPRDGDAEGEGAGVAEDGAGGGGADVGGAGGGALDAPAGRPGASVLVGLHVCGDLGPTMLRIFHHAGAAVGAMVMVGCCYMHLTEEEAAGDGDEDDAEPPAPAAPAAVAICEPCEPATSDLGYPMSSHVRALSFRYGFHMREHACHSLTAYATRLRECARRGESAEGSLRLHGRRAVLELLLRERVEWRGSGRSVAGVGAIRGAAGMSFEEYVAAAFAKLKLDPVPDAELRRLADEAGPMLAQWRRVVVFYVLRLLIAPLWEGLLLLDRLLYLRELGHDATLLPLFDPEISPRSYAMVAFKRGRDGAAATGEGEGCAAEGAAAAVRSRWADAV